MRRAARLVLVLAALGALPACGPDDGRHLAEPDPDVAAVPTPTVSQASILDADPDLQTPGPGGLTLSSPDFSPGSTMPAVSGCEGSTSPALGWTPAPRRARELALVVQDVDGDGTVQWLVTDIPPDAVAAPRGAAPTGGITHRNSVGTATWASPCPSDGIAHRILFRLYVLDRPLPEGVDDPASLVDTLEDTAYGSATLVGRAAPNLPAG